MNTENTNNDSITLGDLWNIIKKNLILIAVIIVAIVLVGGIYTFAIAKEKYKSSTTLIVAVKSGSSDTVDSTYSLRIVGDVAKLATEDIVLDNVAIKNGYDGEEKDKFVSSLRQKVSVSSTTTSFMITISVVDLDPAKTQLYANQIAEELINQCNTSPNLIEFVGNSVSQTTPAKYGVYDSPNKLLYLIVAFVAGCVIAFVVAFVKELMSTKFKSRDEIKKVSGENVIGEIFYQKNIDSSKGLVSDKFEFVEQYNKLLTNVKYTATVSNIKTIMITSTIFGELKSTVLSNLALAMVKNDKKVIVIDLDLRIPSIHKVFNVSKNNGIVDYITTDLDYKEFIKKTSCNVDVITVGSTTKELNPLIFIESEKLKKLLSTLRQVYDYILIDTPPVLPCSDALAVAKIVDAAIYNVAINHSRKKDFKECINVLKNQGVNLLGLVVTKSKLAKSAKDYYYYGDEKDKKW